MSFQPLIRLKAVWTALTYRGDMLSDLRHPTAWLSSWALGARTLAGLDVSPAAAMTLSAYFAAVRAIAEDVGKLPLPTYERLVPRGKRRVYDHPLYPLLHDAPNPYMSAMTWRETMTQHALTWGNGYAPIVRAGGRIVALNPPLHPSRVEPRLNDAGELIYRVRVGDIGIRVARQEVETVDLPQRDMVHLHGLGDGFVGYSVAHMAAESLGVSLAAQQFGASFFANGTHLGGILSHPGTLGDKAGQHLRDSLDKFRTVSDAMKIMILEEGMKYERVGIPPEDAQFLQTREFQVTEIARWFRIPPHKIADLAHATFTNIEHQGLEYVVDTLQPWLVRWEQELKRKLFVQDPTHFAEHLIAGLLRGDMQARAAYHRTLFYIGSKSPNDIREDENENPILDADGNPDPAGDLYYIQNNLATLGTIAGTTTPVQPRVPSDTPFEDAEEDDTDEEDDMDEAAWVPHPNGQNGHYRPYPWEQEESP